MTADSACPFCNIVDGTATADVAYRDDNVIVFLPDEPATLGHVLVVPTEHVPDIWSLDARTAEAVSRITIRTARAAKAAFQLDGLNVIQSNGEAATQTVFHLHVHVVPRYSNDDIAPFWPIGSAVPDADRVRVAGRLAAHISAGLDDD
ncbi:HIT family protein [Nocardioides sp. MH1]|uniref:HIT family protein n=1 Tax=Nocardioides sp. MH1 TaxID=3242490 RepID=UPI003520A226